MIYRLIAALSLLIVIPAVAWAGPPFVTDDPEPTDFKHYEVYLFAQGTNARDGTSGASGIDFNYGAGPNLQLTAGLADRIRLAAKRRHGTHLTEKKRT
jgi:hypothetical protein